MSLLVLMYHRASAGRFGNSPAMLDAHFQHIATNYPTVMPGEPLQPQTPNVCISFDDGYYDFYARIFPLLQRHKLRALLAIPSSVIFERTDAPESRRLEQSNQESFNHPSQGGFCTWPELEEMAASGHVTVAAHGFTHRALDDPKADLNTEVHAPKTILGSRLDQKIESFVFPFGRFSRPALFEARQRYRYVFRIGGALNRHWESRVLYRIDADEMTAPSALFRRDNLTRYQTRFLWNRLRFR
ncbi:MAG: polysaccharide deacetylase family protein [Opitutaceae bacterium]